MRYASHRAGGQIEGAEGAEPAEGVDGVDNASDARAAATEAAVEAAEAADKVKEGVAGHTQFVERYVDGRKDPASEQSPQYMVVAC